MICGGLSNVILEENKFILYLEDDFTFELLNDAKNFTVLKRALDWQELGLEFVIVKKEKEKNKMQEDVEKLKKILGEHLRIEN